MHFTLAAESTLEKNFFVMCEYDDRVLEYWEQPEPISLPYRDKNNRQQCTSHTPDILVIRSDRIEIFEVKAWAKVMQLHSKQPFRWCDLNNEIVDVAAKAAFLHFGFQHRVVTEKEINAVRCQNLEILMRSHEDVHCDVDSKIAKAVIALLAREVAMRMSEIIKALRIGELTPLFHLIDSGVLYTDLDQFRLTAPSETWVASDRHGLDIALESLRCLSVLDAEISREHVPTVKDALVMNDRLRQLQSPDIATVTSRTRRRWSKKLQQASGDSRALLPKFYRRGHRGTRIAPSEIELINRAIEEHYLTPLALSMQATYRAYLVLSELQKSPCAVSRPTFVNFVRKLSLENTARLRGGKRPANAAATPVSPEHRAPDARRPFERGHIDHYLTDIHALIVRTDKKAYTARPWLTAVRDQYSGAILAISLGFRAPSSRACCKVIRDCVRRYHRLPETIVVDHGKEFDSVYFESLLASYRVLKQSRPPGAPRYGGTIESWFGSIKNRLLDALPGNTNNDLKQRSASPSHKANAHAALSLHDIFNAVETFVFEFYNHQIMNRASGSPEWLIEEGLSKFPFSGRRLEFNQEFLVATSVPLKITLKVDPLRGVRHLDRWFLSKDPRVLNRYKAVPAREDPWDANRLYVLFGDAWSTCYHGAMPPEGAQLDPKQMIEATLRLEAQEVYAEVNLEKEKQSHKMLEKVRRSIGRAGIVSRTPIVTPASLVVLPALESPPRAPYHFDEPGDS